MSANQLAVPTQEPLLTLLYQQEVIISAIEATMNGSELAQDRQETTTTGPREVMSLTEKIHRAGALVDGNTKRLGKLHLRIEEAMAHV